MPRTFFFLSQTSTGEAPTSDGITPPSDACVSHFGTAVREDKNLEYKHIHMKNVFPTIIHQLHVWLLLLYCMVLISIQMHSNTDYTWFHIIHSQASGVQLPCVPDYKQETVANLAKVIWPLPIVFPPSERSKALINTHTFTYTNRHVFIF